MESNNLNEALNQRISDLQQAFTEKDSASINDMEPEANQEIKMDYLEMQKTLKDLRTSMASLQADLQKELSIATINGMTPEAGNRIIDLQKQINLSTENAAKLASKIQEHEESLKSQFAGKLRDVKQQVSGSLNKVKNHAVDKVISGVAATSAIVGRVRDANHRAMEVVGVSRDTAYTNVVESVEKVNRNWMAFNYSKDRIITNSLDKVASALESAFERKASIKEAFKDLGRAFRGKERQNDKGEFTQAENSLLSKLKGMSAEIKGDMQRLEKDFNVSREASLLNLSSARELRESSNMKGNDSLNKRFEQAKAESLSSKQSVDRPAPDKNQDRTI